METNIDKPSRGGWYFLGGLAAGTAAGLLLAPKDGDEMREDIGEWVRRNRKRTQSWFSSIGVALPMRARTSAHIGAAKNGTKAFAHAK